MSPLLLPSFSAKLSTRSVTLGALFLALLIIGVSAVVWRSLSLRIVSAIEACEKTGPRKQKCFDDLILQEANQRGISHGFDVLAEIYPRDRDFVLFCHGYTHQLGELAFDRYENGVHEPVSSKTSYCGFGFYHGFLEKLVFSRGELSEARKFCEYVDKELSDSISGVSFACYHGVGHGVVDGSDPSRWGDWKLYTEPGLLLCEKLSKIEEQKARCASGVFNALAIVMHTEKHGFSSDVADPYVACKAQQLPYVRKACYDQMNSFIVETTDTFSDALAIASKNAESAYAEIAVSSVAGYVAQNALGDSAPLAQYLIACNALIPRLANSCAGGFATGLIEFGNPGKEYDSAIALCVISGERRDACFHGIIVSAKDRLQGKAMRALCSRIGRESSTISVPGCAGA